MHSLLQWSMRSKRQEGKGKPTMIPSSHHHRYRLPKTITQAKYTARHWVMAIHQNSSTRTRYSLFPHAFTTFSPNANHAVPISKALGMKCLTSTARRTLQISPTSSDAWKVEYLLPAKADLPKLRRRRGRAEGSPVNHSFLKTKPLPLALRTL